MPPEGTILTLWACLCFIDIFSNSHRSKVHEVETNAEEEIWRKAAGWLCGYGKSGPLILFRLLKNRVAHTYVSRIYPQSTSAKLSRTTVT